MNIAIYGYETVVMQLPYLFWTNERSPAEAEI